MGEQNRSAPKRTPLCLMGTIVERGKGQKVAKAYEKYGVHLNYRISGDGTASSDLLDLLGIGTAERDLLISPVRRETAERLVAQIHQEGIGVRAKGILFVMPLTAASAKAAALLTALAPAEEEELTVEKHIRQSLILIAVNQGCTEEVMNTAREAGARGGTVIRSHTLRSAEQESFGGPTFAGEREILAIVASQSERNAIMEKVDAVHGGEAEARAVLYALPIEAAAHLN